MDITKTPNLIPRNGHVFLQTGFLGRQEGDRMFVVLSEASSWEQRPVKIFGRKIPQPRLTSFFADEGVVYTYSGLTLQGNGWNPGLKAVKERVESFTGEKFNSALLNLYRDGNDYMGWHRDNEKSLGDMPAVASVSLGATRVFQLREYETKKNLVSIELTHGSLLLMKGKTQGCWEHRLPKAPAVTNARMNITFRKIIL